MSLEVLPEYQQNACEGTTDSHSVTGASPSGRQLLVSQSVHNCYLELWWLYNMPHTMRAGNATKVANCSSSTASHGTPGTQCMQTPVALPQDGVQIWIWPAECTLRCTAVETCLSLRSTRQALVLSTASTVGIRPCPSWLQVSRRLQLNDKHRTEIGGFVACDQPVGLSESLEDLSPGTHSNKSGVLLQWLHWDSTSQWRCFSRHVVSLASQ